ncbi:MAG TPA: hypothetical protein PLM79_00955 [Syntrophobacteraceae bacterium]|nr:hypothetical protein [Syntrophobacteraceae bacterium]
MAKKRKTSRKPGKDRRKPREDEAFLKEPGFKKQDISKKLIPLSVLSGKDAEKAAERTIDNVLSAITHVLSEGDLSIIDFGRFKASKAKKTGYIKISFTPAGKLKRAVEARLNAVPSPDPDSEGAPAPAVDPASAPEPPPQSQSEQASEETQPGVQPEASPAPAPEPSSETPAPAEEAPISEPEGVQETAESSETSGSDDAAIGTNVNSLPPEAPELKSLDSISVENRTIVADGEEFGIAENLTVLDPGGNVMNFDDLVAALQHLTLVSKISIISKTTYRVTAATISIINALQIHEYMGVVE